LCRNVRQVAPNSSARLHLELPRRVASVRLAPLTYVIRRPRLAWLRSSLPLRFGAAGLFFFAQILSVAKPAPQSVRPHEELHGVVSRLPLKAPLRNAEVLLRYSPDGRDLMIQNPSGIFLLSREPLEVRVHLTAEEVYPAQFSFDSQEITAVGHGLTLNRDKIPSGPVIEQRELPFRDGCLDAKLAPGGELFACLKPNMTFVVYRLATNEVIFSASLEEVSPTYRIVHVPLDPDTAFSGPFGFRLANTLDSLAGRGMNFISMDFSSDGKILLARNESEAFTVDLATRTKANLAGWLHKRLRSSFCLQKDQNVLIASGGKDAPPVVVSLKTAAVTANPAFKADVVRLAANPRYALLTDPGVSGVRVFDLQENRELNVPSNLSIDIFAKEMAVLNESGSIFIYHLGDKLPFADTDLPLDSLPVLRAAAVTPNLDRIAFSVDGSSAAFQVATGERTYTGPRFSAWNFSDQASAYCLLPRNNSNPPRMVELASGSDKPATAWSGGKDFLRSGGTVLLEYALGFSPARRMVVTQDNYIPYRLRGLDLATGKELWKREFLENSPIPFADPQGGRVVLGWNAQDPGAQSAAKKVPSAWEIFKHAKISKLDAYFEILDALTGKSIGGVLVQVGSGPASYDAAFSTGDALFLLKDRKRVSVYSLQDGSLKARMVGGLPSANAQSNLFAVDEGLGRLSIYDLATNAKLDHQIFPEPLAYTHFSADGKRLLVLTKHQVVYVLDLSGVRGALSGPASFASSAPTASGDKFP